ncbi:hypothetical protein KGF56_003709 [Candida oxycetoniae]|uniref:Uncharacterized protein n=1 Tax=Candida oxycetoniae TaxID=497107 RepID=A0AAI9SVG5_9ASCO|nr:uncharacterized protein KGF56_003709 [Candida oxycetoniae]KAI3403425.1 hypothetical protein KGF56_003709 [Candida oxycetoniae]
MKFAKILAAVALASTANTATIKNRELYARDFDLVSIIENGVSDLLDAFGWGSSNTNTGTAATGAATTTTAAAATAGNGGSNPTTAPTTATTSTPNTSGSSNNWLDDFLDNLWNGCYFPDKFWVKRDDVPSSSWPVYVQPALLKKAIAGYLTNEIETTPNGFSQLLDILNISEIQASELGLGAQNSRYYLIGQLAIVLHAEESST